MPADFRAATSSPTMEEPDDVLWRRQGQTGMTQEPVKELDVQAVYGSRQQVNDVLAETPLQNAADRVAVGLFLLSSRDDIWAVHVLSALAAERGGTDAWTILTGLSAGSLEAISDIVPEDWESEALGEWVSSIAGFLVSAFNSEALVAAAISTPLIEDCIRQDGSPEQVKDCILRGIRTS
jgi:hypothetical protein